MRPVTIKQILDCNPNHQFENNTYKIDDVEIAHITFVARVMNITELPTNINYVVDDGTGKCDVKQWKDLEEGGDNNTAQSLMGQYVRVIGHLKTHNNKRHISAFAILPVKDYNEVQYHLLEAVYIHLYLTRGPLMGEGGGAHGAGAAYGAGATYGGQAGARGDVAMGGTGDSGGGYGGGGYGGGGAGGLPAGMTQTARVVYQAIKSSAHNSDEGIHMNIIASRTHLGMEAVTRAVDELVASGIAFTTLDDNHVAVMDC
ncbi:replication protein A, subunit RPA32 [Ascodesmis nigricans]|uniref:Replication protein A, subunit RPA32 n=1 Tax=Ascodesmis nigricans TaxID=341454 RepID=A0A4S2N1Y3_9PEZI|nr:replication protein A, subunit RPA32 [Ascodesmis nigricans]